MNSARFILIALSLWRSTSVVALQQQQLVIYGLGNVGRAVVEEAPRDWVVHGTTRTEGIDDSLCIPFETASRYLPDASHVLVTIPPNPDISPTILADLRSHLCPSSWVGFVSTSGVYGNHDGAWVQEDSPLLCSSSATKYVEFEQALINLADSQGWNASVFRCAGLYGPSRSALHTLWKKGRKTTKVAASPDVFITNRIHERDVARAIVSAMQKKSNGVYNLGDEQPEAREVVMEYAAQLLDSNGMTVPQSQQTEEQRPKTKRGERRMKERKLVDGGKMKAELIEKLLYPTYREGLNAIFAEKGSPWWKSE